MPLAGAAEFLRWARAAARPLPEQAGAAGASDFRAIDDLLGDCHIVALSEAVHGGAEPLEFRNALFRHLVERQGFSAIAVESGLVESQCVHAYVRGQDGRAFGHEFDTIVAQGFSWTFDRLPQNRELVRWLRSHNSGAAEAVRFYGFDVPGSPGETHVARHLDTALRAVLTFLNEVDPEQHRAFDARFARFLPLLSLNSTSPAGYESLDSSSRDELTANLADLHALFATRERAYTRAASADRYWWGHQAVIGAWQIDEWLRCLPKHSSGAVEDLAGPILPSLLGEAADRRDRAQFDNLEQILLRERLAGRVLVFGHRYHLCGAPIEANWIAGSGLREVMGTYLRRRYGSSVLLIGHVVGSGVVGCPGPRCCDGVVETLAAPPAESLESLAGQLGSARYVLDLRRAPLVVRRWLDGLRDFGRGTPGQGWDVLRTDCGAAFDILFYTEKVRSACADSGRDDPHA